MTTATLAALVVLCAANLFCLFGLAALDARYSTLRECHLALRDFVKTAAKQGNDAAAETDDEVETLTEAIEAVESRITSVERAMETCADVMSHFGKKGAPL